MAELRPTVFCSVPRLYNRVFDGYDLLLLLFKRSVMVIDTDFGMCGYCNNQQIFLSF